MALKSATLASALLFISSVNAFCAEPVLGERQSLAGSKYHWQLDQGASLVLEVFKGQSQRPLASYDLENCMFCAGEDDNCESDGIVEINLSASPEEPILAVACHIGAHSQRLQIFAPRQNNSGAIFAVSGAYYVSYEITPEGVTVEYDVRNDSGTFRKQVGSWP